MTRVVVERAVDQRSFREETIEADLVVVGGGTAGTCCAITAARAGLRVVLVQDRPVLGGNSSSEIRVPILGAASNGAGNNRWAREGGVLDEILVENLHRNPQGNFAIFDTILLEKVVEEDRITLLLNTTAIDVATREGRITSVRAFCSQNSTMYDVRAPLYCDASGDGVLGYLSGAAYRMGAEAAAEFDEGFAPTEEWGYLLGHTIMFTTRDAGSPIRYVPPSYALEDITKVARWRRFTTNNEQYALNWIEWGGRLDTVHDTERIKFELWRVIHGAWNHIKNSGEYPDAANLDMDWVGTVPGKRESRRFEGLYMLRQQDIVEQVEHADVVAYGGWAIDLHPADGIFSEQPAETFLWPRGTYGIPYRCLVSRDVENLFLAGRVLSASHVAFGSTRVMGTGAHVGQAVGMAAALCIRDGVAPAELYGEQRMRELQVALLRTGHHLPGIPLEDPADLVRDATVTASSELSLSELPADGRVIRLTHSHAQLVPVRRGRVPAATFTVDVSGTTTLRIEARVSDRVDNHTPDVVLAFAEFALNAGERQSVAFDPGIDIDDDRYVFYVLVENDRVSVHTSTRRVTGMMAVFHRETQEPKESIGRRRTELWAPLGGPYWGRTEQHHGYCLAFELSPAVLAFAADSVSNGYSRPTNMPNAWVAARHDAAPRLTVRWPTAQSIGSVVIGFDTDFDHPMLTGIVVHDEPEIPFCAQHYRLLAGNRVIAEVTDNHQTRAQHVFDPPVASDLLALEIIATHGDVPAAVFEFRCYEEDLSQVVALR